MSTENERCMMCLKATRPELTTTEMVALGASTLTMCDRHREAFEELSKILTESYQNTKGATA